MLGRAVAEARSEEEEQKLPSRLLPVPASNPAPVPLTPLPRLLALWCPGPSPYSQEEVLRSVSRVRVSKVGPALCALPSTQEEVGKLASGWEAKLSDERRAAAERAREAADAKADAVEKANAAARAAEGASWVEGLETG